MNWKFWRRDCRGGDCDKVLERVYDFLNKSSVSPSETDEIKKHLDDCRPCWDRYEFEQKLIRKLRGAGACACPESLKKRIQSLLELF